MGLFDKFATGLAKTRTNMVREVMGSFGKGRLTEEVIENVEEKLLAADISMETADLIMGSVREKARGLEIDNQQLLAWMAQATRELLPEAPKWEPKGKPHVVLMIGINGAGKTTTIAKLAHHHQRAGRKVLLAAADTFRAGAIAQLERWAERLGLEVIKHHEGSDAASVAYDAYAAAKARGADVLIVDTAGRLHTKTNLMDELKKLIRVLRKHDESLPHECLLVVDGNTGQNAIAQGKGFGALVRLDGLVVTKLDGTAKGGAITPLCREFGIPVLWVGVGEDLEDLIPFSREDYVQGLYLKGGETVDLLALPSGKTAADYYLGV